MGALVLARRPGALGRSWTPDVGKGTFPHSRVAFFNEGPTGVTSRRKLEKWRTEVARSRFWKDLFNDDDTGTRRVSRTDCVLTDQIIWSVFVCALWCNIFQPTVRAVYSTKQERQSESCAPNFGSSISVECNAGHGRTRRSRR